MGRVTWHLEEKQVKASGKQRFLWSAVGSDGEVLDFVVTDTCDREAALTNLRRLLGPEEEQKARGTTGKRDHEARFKGIGDSLRQSFRSSYSDATDRLNPTGNGLCKRLEQVLPDCVVDEDDAKTRATQLNEYVERMRKVPEPERDFMLVVIRRAAKLDDANSVLVHVDDVKNALSVPVTRMKSLGKAMERHGVGDIDLYSTNGEDEPHVYVRDPSEYVTWFDIVQFCDKSGLALEDFVIRLKFGLLD